MTTQLNLFSPPAVTIPLAANRDPVSSHEAAQHMRQSGKLNKQQEKVFAAFKKFPNTTSNELAHYAGFERHMAGRRMSDLAALGYVVRGPVRPCKFGRPAVEWRLR